VKHFLNWLAVTLDPRFWIMFGRRSPAWDLELRRLIDTGEPFVPITECRARIGRHKTWIKNYPYGAFTLVSPFDDKPTEIRPSRRTVRLAWKHLRVPSAYAQREASVRQMIDAARAST